MKDAFKFGFGAATGGILGYAVTAILAGAIKQLLVDFKSGNKPAPQSNSKDANSDESI